MKKHYDEDEMWQMCTRDFTARTHLMNLLFPLKFFPQLPDIQQQEGRQIYNLRHIKF